jgi:UDP:flavonoid glycosyltransferase YjiC (YdhE family)
MPAIRQLLIETKMKRKKILFISGSIGLGHITRDIAIARELRRQDSNIEISWLASHPADLVLQNAGEKLVPQAKDYLSDNLAVDNVAKGSKLNLFAYAYNVKKIWFNHLRIFQEIMDKGDFDLVVGDETYELAIATLFKRSLKKRPFVMIYDFVGLDSMSKNPLEKIGTYALNFIWSRLKKQVHDLALFVGEPEDVPDKSFGPFLPNRRRFAENNYEFIGYVFPFDPSDYSDKLEIRGKLGYGKDPLVICSIGGTSVGKELLELCVRAYPIIREKKPNLRMILVSGPLLSSQSIKIPEGVEIKDYVHGLYEHFAACDLAVVQGGGTSTLELTALNKPFIYFPREGDCEQQLHVAERLARHNAGVKMSYSKTIPETLAQKVISHLGKYKSYPSIASNGAQRAARSILMMICLKK